MNPSDFELIAGLLKQRSGLVVTPDKGYLLESRLSSVARRWDFKSFEDMAQAIRLKRDEKLLSEITEAMTTNESFFFRDTKPFDQFRDLVLPHLLEARAPTKRIRIWSAACSTGQEPYSLAILLKEAAAKLAGWHIEIIATDLSNEVLDKAREGLYSQFEAQRGLPITLLVKYFTQAGDQWQISDELRRMVTFRSFNLLDSPASMGRFDVIFLRNVLIYFDPPTKAKILDGMSRQLADDGFLYLGGAETVLGVSDKFKPKQGERGIYELTSSQESLAKAS